MVSEIWSNLSCTDISCLAEKCFDIEVGKDTYSLHEAKLTFSMPASPHAIH